jgi:transcriptional regulator with AAA-type ATPase domain
MGKAKARTDNKVHSASQGNSPVSYRHPPRAPWADTRFAELRRHRLPCAGTLVEQTQDPLALSASRDDGQTSELIVIDVLAHPDLRRVGDRAVLLEDRAVIGREEPLFLPPNPDAGGRTLDDPCISRRQFALTYDRVARRFTVVSSTSTRRSLMFFDAAGRELSSDGQDLEPGSLVAIGDRVLLALGVRLAPLPPPLGMTGRSAALDEVRTHVLAFARLERTVLIHGPTGAGKERVARALHRASARAAEPFVAVNCAALPEALMESELFGHVRGAFSGASGSRDGLFVEAHGGVLLLDEVGELSPSAQAKLLRVLQEQRIRPIGGSSERAVDVWIVAATHRDLGAEVAAGRFREDLLARLDGLSLLVPALAARRSDVPLLFASVLQQRCAAHPELAHRLIREADRRAPPLPLAFILSLLQEPWPRNVRELERFVDRTVALSLAQRSLSFPPLAASASTERERPSEASSAKERPDAVQLRVVIERCDYVTQRAARALGVSHTTVDRWMRELGILRPRDLSAEAVINALVAANQDVRAAARALQVSERGLRLRLSELELAAAK